MEKPTKQVLSNGIILIHKQVKPLPIVGIKLFIRLGSINEPDDIAGITNLTQLLLIKGTKTRTAEQIALELESVGGSISSSSNEDFSEVSISITNKHFNKAMEIMADVLLNPVFPGQELAKEKMVTIAGIKSRKDHIFNVALDLLMKNLYGSHPYSRLTIGSEESVQKITRDDIVNWHKKYYGSPNLLIVVVGNVTLSETKKNIMKYFSQLPVVNPTAVSLPEINIKERKSIVQKTKFEQAYLMCGFLAPEISNKDFISLKVLDAYLGGGMSSELFQRLREQAGIGYEVDSFYPSRKDKSRYVIYLGLDKTSIPLAKEKINSLITEIKTKHIDTKKLNEVKNYVKGIYLLDHQTASRQAWYFGWWEMLNKGYEYDNQYTTDIDKVTDEGILQAANKYLTDNCVWVELQPEK